MVIKSTPAAKELWKQTTFTACLVDDSGNDIDWFFLLEIKHDRVLIAGGEHGPPGNFWLERKFWVNGKLKETFIFDSFDWPSY